MGDRWLDLQCGCGAQGITWNEQRSPCLNRDPPGIRCMLRQKSSGLSGPAVPAGIRAEVHGSRRYQDELLGVMNCDSTAISINDYRHCIQIQAMDRTFSASQSHDDRFSLMAATRPLQYVRTGIGVRPYCDRTFLPEITWIHVLAPPGAMAKFVKAPAGAICSCLMGLGL